MVPAPQSRKMHSVFFTIFFSLLLVLVIELTLLIGTIIVGQVPSRWMTMRRKFCANRWKIAADICRIFWFLRRS